MHAEHLVSHISQPNSSSFHLNHVAWCFVFCTRQTNRWITKVCVGEWVVMLWVIYLLECWLLFYYYLYERNEIFYVVLVSEHSEAHNVVLVFYTVQFFIDKIIDIQLFFILSSSRIIRPISICVNRSLKKVDIQGMRPNKFHKRKNFLKLRVSMDQESKAM